MLFGSPTRRPDFRASYRIDQTCRRRISGLYLGIVADRAEAEDLAQEVFLQLFRKVSYNAGDLILGISGN